jgi:tartrate dehydrogenase/decarboxylase / D-malate dehydrogenase
VTARREVVPPDLGGKATTQQVTDAVIAAIRGANLSETPGVDS